ncbi:MAG: hypothetical protein KDD53_07305 [Bdellovibrionales bacterium]|nr:hypothetical protein [Bdellovibrionales bacterium]
MSFLSARNFVAPITSKRNLMAIILAAVFFAILRFSGAGISIDSVEASRSNSKQEQKSAYQADLQQLGVKPYDAQVVQRQLEEKMRMELRAKMKQSGDSVDTILNSRNEKVTEPKPRPSSDRLTEIERKLGLR